MALPGGFVDLAKARQSTDGTFVNIIGVVVDIMAPTTTKKGTYMFTFKLLDHPLSMAISGSDGLPCRFFKEDPESLPKVRNIGDVVLLRNAKVTIFGGEILVLSNFQTSTLVFPGGGIPSKAFSIAYVDKQRIECLGTPLDVEKFKLGEQEYIIHLKDIMGGRIALEAAKHSKQPGLSSDAIVPPPAKRQKTEDSANPKYRLVKDLQPKTFVDLYGIVVKCISAAYGGCDLYVTDYTPNKEMRYYPSPEEGDPHGRDGDHFSYTVPSGKSWQGPWGWLVLKVNLKPPHAQYASANVREGDMVFLRNVKIQYNREGVPRLEGDMWPDDRNRDRVLISKVATTSAPEVQAILQRKEKYWAARRIQLGEDKDKDGERQPSNRQQKKKLKKQEKRERQKVAQATSEPEVNPTKDTAKVKTNPNVRCSHEEVAVTRVKDILDADNLNHTNESPTGHAYLLPFINAKYRARVRVVDYDPKSLEDFAVQSELEGGSSPDSMDWQFTGNSPSYEWSFSLLLEDAVITPSKEDADAHRMWVHLQHEQAVFLFGNGVEDPDDLRHNSALLGQLREKLFILWGNLEEKGEEESLSNLPFVCCIEEYGVQLDEAGGVKTDGIHGWQRMYGMFGTTIQ